MITSSDVWVFGYGSLMWNPGFDYLKSSKAVLGGYHRDLCILSYVYRGTYECPGLVMGLNKGGSCIGKAFLVSENNWEAVHRYLLDREMINNVYKPQWVSLHLEDGLEVQAYTFVADEDHDQHVGSHPIGEKIKILLQGSGTGGTSLEYLENTLAHLRDWEIRDANLETILAKAYEFQNCEPVNP